MFDNFRQQKPIEEKIFLPLYVMYAVFLFLFDMLSIEKCIYNDDQKLFHRLSKVLCSWSCVY